MLPKYVKPIVQQCLLSVYNLINIWENWGKFTLLVFSWCAQIFNCSHGSREATLKVNLYITKICSTFNSFLFQMHLQRVMKVMMKIWVPCPRKTDRSMPILGGLNTSPWTCFQPDSSWASSCRRYDISQYDLTWLSSDKPLWPEHNNLNSQHSRWYMWHVLSVSIHLSIHCKTASFIFFFTLIGEYGNVQLHCFTIQRNFPEAKQLPNHNLIKHKQT